jgi:hypothetical protein
MRVPLITLLTMLVLAGAAQPTRAESNVAGRAQPAGTADRHVQARLAGKSFQALYTSTFLDGVADGISGRPLSTVLEDDPVEWTLFGVDANVLGFVCITDADPNGWCYHRVFLGPPVARTFIGWLNGQAPTYWDAAVAIMSITHEATHYQLFSTDEGRVNACALRQFPGVIDRYFGIHPTVTKTVALKRVVWRKKRVRVRRHGRWVRIVKRVPHVVTAYEQRTMQNADYVDLVQAAQQFYASQPPPYNTGTCW